MAATPEPQNQQKLRRIVVLSPFQETFNASHCHKYSRAFELFGIARLWIITERAINEAFAILRALAFSTRTAIITVAFEYRWWSSDTMRSNASTIISISSSPPSFPLGKWSCKTSGNQWIWLCKRLHGHNADSEIVILNEKRNTHHDSLYGLYHLSIPRVLGKRNGGWKVSLAKSATFILVARVAKVQKMRHLPE